MNCRTCNTRIPGRAKICPNCGRSAVNAPLRDAPSSGPVAGKTQVAPEAWVLQRGSGTAEAKGTFNISPKLAASELIALLAAQPELLEPGLCVPVGQAGAGDQSTDVGNIDLLLADASGDLVVVMVPERDWVGDLVVEVLRRMGWVRKHRAGANCGVRGVVLLPSDAGPAGYAAAALSETVSFKTYRVELAFDSCPF